MKKKNTISNRIKFLAPLFVFALVVQSCNQAPKEVEKEQIVEVNEKSPNIFCFVLKLKKPMDIPMP